MYRVVVILWCRTHASQAFKHEPAYAGVTRTPTLLANGCGLSEGAYLPATAQPHTPKWRWQYPLPAVFSLRMEARPIVLVFPPCLVDFINMEGPYGSPPILVWFINPDANSELPTFTGKYPCQISTFHLGMQRFA